jgi:obg-like ATPase 1
MCKACVIFIIFRLIKIKEWVDKNDPGAVIIPFSGAFENRLLEMNDEERKIYLEEMKATR